MATSLEHIFANLRSSVIFTVQELIQREPARTDLIRHEIHTLIEELAAIGTPAAPKQTVLPATSASLDPSLTSDLPSILNYCEDQPDVDSFSSSYSARPPCEDAETLLTPNLNNVLNKILVNCANNKPDSLHANSNLTVTKHLDHDEEGSLSFHHSHQLFLTEPCRAWPAERFSTNNLKVREPYDTQYAPSPQSHYQYAGPSRHPSDYEWQEQLEIVGRDTQEQEQEPGPGPEPGPAPAPAPVPTYTSLSVKNRKRKFGEPQAEVTMCKVKRKSCQTPRKAAPHQIRAFGERSRKAIPKASTKLFKESVYIPPEIIQPDDLYRLLANRSEKKYDDMLPLLTRLFFAIASPDAFSQLSEACMTVRQEQASPSVTTLNEVLPPMQILDHLDAKSSVSSTLRRFHLTRLLDRRINLGNDYKNTRSRRTTKQRKHDSKQLNGLLDRGDIRNGDERSARIDTKALTDIMAESYPHLKQPRRDKSAFTDAKYRDRLSKLQNRLSCARNWHALQQKCSPGILALVPCGGEFQIQIDRVERLPSSIFSVFLEVLFEKRGSFLVKVSQSVSRHIQNIVYRKDLTSKYAFETVDKMLLKQEPMDSQQLIRFCALE